MEVQEVKRVVAITLSLGEDEIGTLCRALAACGAADPGAAALLNVLAPLCPPLAEPPALVTGQGTLPFVKEGSDAPPVHTVNAPQVIRADDPLGYMKTLAVDAFPVAPPPGTPPATPAPQAPPPGALEMYVHSEGTPKPAPGQLTAEVEAARVGIWANK